MKTYLVRWEIDIEADSPEAAAQKALEIQRRSDSIATVFEVTETRPDPWGGSPILFGATKTIDLTLGAEHETH